MSKRHPIISVTGSSGAGTTTVKHIFDQIFRRKSIVPATIEGDAFHRFDHAGMKQAIADAATNGEAAGPAIPPCPQAWPMSRPCSGASS